MKRLDLLPHHGKLLICDDGKQFSAACADLSIKHSYWHPAAKGASLCFPAVKHKSAVWLVWGVDAQAIDNELANVVTGVLATRGLPAEDYSAGAFDNLLSKLRSCLVTTPDLTWDGCEL